MTLGCAKASGSSSSDGTVNESSNTGVTNSESPTTIGATSPPATTSGFPPPSSEIASQLTTSVTPASLDVGAAATLSATCWRGDQVAIRQLVRSDDKLAVGPRLR